MVPGQRTLVSLLLTDLLFFSFLRGKGVNGRLACIVNSRGLVIAIRDKELSREAI